jgi:putative transposase
VDVNSLAHTKWNCKYHVVFAPKFRRKIIYNELRQDIGKIIRMLCERKGITIIEAELCPDHIHMLIGIPPKMSVAEAIGYIKGKSTLLIFDRHADMKYKYGQRQFWCRGYYVDTVGKNTKAIQEYIANQLKNDKLADDMSSKEYVDPFTGKKVKQFKLFK